jgi:16S rRNA (adenine1518-N6/adenine1519-N6)-dimethyltransferase
VQTLFYLIAHALAQLGGFMDRAKRRAYGQNFLVSTEVPRMIVGDLPIKTHDCVLEIGPGEGALTIELLHRGANVTAIEIDAQCVELLQIKFAQKPFQVVHQDFLTVDLPTILKQTQALWIVGNLPYNRATGIIEKILPFLHLLKGCMFMVQLEVAQRICANPGCKDYGSLTTAIQMYAQAQMLHTIGPEHFHPRPKVQSATFMLTPHTQPQIYRDPTMEPFIRNCFRQKRKNLLNCLEPFYSKDLVRQALATLGKTPHARAEELSLAEFYNLWQLLKNP